jgi:hypothetical protein
MMPKRLGRLCLQWAGVISLVVTVVSLLVTGGWGYYKWRVAGADDWMVNLDMTTEILPYPGSDELRLLVINVKSKNSTTNEIEFKPRDATFTLTAHRLPLGLKADSKLPPADPRNAIVPPFDLMAESGDGYEFMPGAEFEDTEAIVVKVKTTVRLTATLTRKQTLRGSSDFVSVDRFVVVDDK